MNLTSTNDLRAEIRQTLDALLLLLGALVPGAEVHHIGATSVPGALTKGDEDVLVQVAKSGFAAAVAALDTDFGRRQSENWRADFASFGDDTGYAQPVGVQLAVRGSERDFFLYLRDCLLSDPGVLEQCNQLKLAHAGSGDDAYREAKHGFYTALLARRP